MLHVALMILIATGGMVVLAQRWQKYAHPVPRLADDPDVTPVSVISHGGLFRLAAPQDSPPPVAFSDLHLVRGGIALHPANGTPAMAFPFANVQWVSAVTLTDDGTADIVIHYEVQQHWRILQLRLPHADMALLTRVLKQTIPTSRSNLGYPASPPVGPVQARLASETMQGETTLGDEIGLYLLPHMLVVLDEDRVRMKLDTSSIRRILAVEKRAAQHWRNLLGKEPPQGIIRLYSLHETASFALADYHAMAREISTLSRCPVEFISQGQKSHK